MKYISQRKQFERIVTELLTRLGAQQQQKSCPWPEFILATRAGPLRLGIHTHLWAASFSNGDNSPWVSSRFDDVDAARLLVDCNPYSGKWNFHLWHNWTDDFGHGLSAFEYQLRKVLVEVPA